MSGGRCATFLFSIQIILKKSGQWRAPPVEANLLRCLVGFFTGPATLCRKMR
jgi:hypothetical protein